MFRAVSSQTCFTAPFPLDTATPIRSGYLFQTHELRTLVDVWFIDMDVELVNENKEDK